MHFHDMPYQRITYEEIDQGLEILKEIFAE